MNYSLPERLQQSGIHFGAYAHRNAIRSMRAPSSHRFFIAAAIIFWINEA